MIFIKERPNKQKEELRELHENTLIKLNEWDKLHNEEIHLQTINMNSMEIALAFALSIIQKYYLMIMEIFVEQYVLKKILF